jgi:hypothetical protein
MPREARWRSTTAAAAGLALGAIALAAAGEEGPHPIVREAFDRDPGWEGLRNRLLPERLPVVRQDFGHRPSNLAGGKAPGEIGGTVQRSTTRAWYAMPISPKTMNERLSASGKLAVTRADASSGVMIGWFHESSRGWRTPSSLAMRIDGNGGKFWLFFEYGTRSGRTGGGGAFEGPRYQTTTTETFRADGKAHEWSLDYDPGAAGAQGSLVFRIDGRRYEVEVPRDHREEGATFTRFGIWNVQIGGESMDAYFDDLVVDGRAHGLDAAGPWTGEGNAASFEERVIRPLHDCGFSPTAHAGGAPGEVGGIVFRDERPAFYAANVGKLTLDDRLRASGRVALLGAGSDSGVCFGWFDGDAKRRKTTSELEAPQPGYLGVIIEGPSRVGHYFRAAYSDGQGSGQSPCEDPRTGAERPVILPDGRPHRWSIEYDPAAAGGSGRITVQLDDSVHALDLKPEHRARGATLDRFGVFNIQAGGHQVELYLDDVEYTSARR